MKHKFLFGLFLLFIFSFFSCSFVGTIPNSQLENQTTSVSLVSIKSPDFFVTDLNSKTTNIFESMLSRYYGYKELPQNEDVDEIMDIKPLIYKKLDTENPPSDFSVETSEDETIITPSIVPSSTNIWDYALDSKNIWQFKANTNYKVTFEAKADVVNVDDAIVLVELKDSLRTHLGANICPKLTDEYKTFSFETGTFDKDWNGHLQIAVGLLKTSFYIKNLKIQEITTNSIPAGCKIADANEFVEIEKLSNGIQFSFDDNDGENKSSAQISGFSVEENKLYEVVFNVSANEKNIPLNINLFAIDENYSRAYKKVSVGPKPIPIKMYIPGTLINQEEYRFLTLEIQPTKKSIISVTDIQVSELSSFPMDVDLLVKINDNYGEITTEDSYVIGKIPSDKSFSLEIAFTTINSQEINEEDFSRLYDFSDTIPFWLTITNDTSGEQIEQKFTNSSTEEKFFKIYLDSNWKICLEENSTPIIDGTPST